jgi:hypothetical protein
LKENRKKRKRRKKTKERNPSSSLEPQLFTKKETTIKRDQEQQEQ